MTQIITLVVVTLFVILGWLVHRGYKKKRMASALAERLTRCGTTPVAVIFQDGVASICINGRSFPTQPGSVYLLDLSGSADARWNFRKTPS